MKYEIIPSILVENLDDFKERIEICEDFAETVQWDIMDGQFVEQMTFSDLQKMKEVDTVLSIEAHLMVEHPEEILNDLAKAGVDRVIFHIEAVDDIEDLLNRMDDYDFEKAIAINPETELDEIPDILDRLDMVLIMTVVPGAGGQPFISSQLDKVKALRSRYPQLSISVDGGIDTTTIKLAKDAGANCFSVGTAIFESPDPANAFEVLKTMITSS